MDHFYGLNFFLYIQKDFFLSNNDLTNVYILVLNVLSFCVIF